MNEGDLSPLAPTRERVLAAIAALTAEFGFPPTNREIGAFLGIASTGHVDYHIRVLEHQGRIVREPGLARSIRVVEQPAPHTCPTCTALQAELVILQAQIAAMRAAARP